MPLSKRAYSKVATAYSWEELWEAGSYFKRFSETLETAQDYAVIVGWQIDSRLPLPSPTGTLETLKEKAVRLCEAKPDFRIYFLMWDHAYFYCLEREIWQGRQWYDVHPKIHFIFDNRHPYGASHHEKLVILDGKIAFCGGIDLCAERWDSPKHPYYDPRRSLNWKEEKHGPYHDLAIQVTGPVCADLLLHVAQRWKAISSTPFPDPPYDAWAGHRNQDIHHRVYVSRTIANVDAGSSGPSIIREIEFLFKDIIAAAQKRIILEGQYFWSKEINDALISKIQSMKGKNFEVYIVLAELQSLKSLTRQMAGYELTLLEKVQSAASFAGVKLVIGSPYVFPPNGSKNLPPKPVYIHSKAIIIDDRFFSVGSANFSSRALRVDTEMQLTLESETDSEKAHIRRIGERFLNHWGILQESPEKIRLRQYLPRIEMETIRRNLPWSFRFPWHSFFDPRLPWAYGVKRRYRNLARNQFPMVVFAITLIWTFGSVTALALAGTWQLEPPAFTWPAVYGAILASVWLLPIPYVLISLFAGLHLGPTHASRVTVSSFWVAALIGYALARMFPTAATKYYRNTGPKWLPGRIGLRRFPVLISVLLDPRVSIRSKIAYQGLYSVPFPWFLVGTGLILPGFIYVLTEWSTRLLEGSRFQAQLHPITPTLLSILTLASLSKVLTRLWQKAD